MRYYSFARTTTHTILIMLLCITLIRGQNLPEQKISIRGANLSLGDVIRILEPKTHYTFSFFNEALPLTKKVTLDIQDKTLQQILGILSEDFSVTFTRINNIITVKRVNEKIENPSVILFGTLRGTVKDSLTGENMPYANVSLVEANTGCSTDARGYFIIPSIPANKEYTIIISFVGYTPKKVRIFIRENKITPLNILLSKSVIEMKSISVSGEKLNDEDVSVQNLLIKDIENMNFGIETDIMRVIQLQSGVQSAGDVSARYYVRGGASNENLVCLNGTTIYNPFHALGIFSVIDPEIINGIEFYKGGFAAKFDGRLSSVTNIITKDGNKNNFSTTAAISQLTVKSMVEGPIPNGSFIITGRKSISNEILKKFTNNSSVPIDFYDASFKVNYSLPEDISIVKFTAFGFISQDKIEFGDKLHSIYDWKNSHLGLNIFSAKQNNPLFAEFTVSLANFSGKEIPNSNIDRHIENTLADFSIKGNINLTLGTRDELYWGCKYQNINTKLFLSNSAGITSEIPNNGTSINSYAGFKLVSIEDLKIDFSTLINLINMSKNNSLIFEPRANIIYFLTPTLFLKGAWGIFQQELVTITDENEVLAMFEPWTIIPKYLKASTAIHYIAGIEFTPLVNLKFNLESYYKVMHNLAVLNDNLVYPTDDQFVAATGKSYGMEFTINHKYNWINTQFSYSYSWTTKKVNNFEYHPRYDCRHSIKVFVSCDLGHEWKSGISWNYNSGLPYTQIYGYYNKFNPQNVFMTQPLISDGYGPFPIYATRNAAQLPDYHRLDVNLSKTFTLWNMLIDLDLSIINLYDRNNFFYFDAKTNNRVNMLPFFPTVDLKVQL